VDLAPSTLSSGQSSGRIEADRRTAVIGASAYNRGSSIRTLGVCCVVALPRLLTIGQLVDAISWHGASQTLMPLSTFEHCARHVMPRNGLSVSRADGWRRSARSVRQIKACSVAGSMTFRRFDPPPWGVTPPRPKSGAAGREKSVMANQTISAGLSGRPQALD
jgi:hypothetical protein